MTNKNACPRTRNPWILMIRFHALSHWKATMEYHKTRDILHVMQFLSRRSIKTTLRYTQRIAFANDVEQAKQLIASGFDYITDIDGHRLFRKRK